MQADLLVRPWLGRLAFALRGQRRHAVFNVAVGTGKIGANLLKTSVVTRLADAADNRDFHRRLPIINTNTGRASRTDLSGSDWDDENVLATRTRTASSQVRRLDTQTCLAMWAFGCELAL